jgi:DNA polymerase delta subunit 1
MKRADSSQEVNGKRLKTTFEQELEDLHNEQETVHLHRTNKRQEVPEFKSLIFQQIEVEDYQGFLPSFMPNPYKINEQSIIRMFGVTQEGNSVMAHVYGFLPYIYVPAPMGFQSNHLTTYKNALQGVMSNMWKGKSDGPCVVDISMAMKNSK